MNHAPKPKAVFEIKIRSDVYFRYDGTLRAGTFCEPREMSPQEALYFLRVFTAGYSCGSQTASDYYMFADAYVDGVCYENEAFVDVFKKAYNI